jgi:hypothetical protein
MDELALQTSSSAFTETDNTLRKCALEWLIEYVLSVGSERGCIHMEVPEENIFH